MLVGMFVALGLGPEPARGLPCLKMGDGNTEGWESQPGASGRLMVCVGWVEGSRDGCMGKMSLGEFVT